MLVTRCRSTSRQASSQSSRSPDSSTVAAPRATCGRACMPAPCDSGATTSETSCSVVAGHQVAQMVADDVFHLPMRQHAGLRPPGGAGGVEEPRRMVVRDIGRARHRRSAPAASASHSSPANGNLQPAGRVFRLRRRRMIRERRIEDVHRWRRRTTPDTPPPAGSGGNSSAPTPRRASTTRTSSPARHWNCARAAARGRHAARRAPPAHPPPPGPARRTPPRSRCASRQMIAGRSGNRRAVCNSRCARLLVGISADGSRIDT